MNIYNFDVNFTTGRIYAPDFILVVNDHNSTLFKFTFDQTGRYVFKLLYPDGTIYVQDITDNQLKLTKGVLNQEGNYKFEISLYGDDNRLTTARIKEFPVRLELVSTDEPVQADDRLPILDNLIEETNKVVEASKNGDLDGATFTPSVSDKGDLSWTNDKGKENPPTVNIAGPPGAPGAVKMQVVNTLPDVGETDTIYLVKKDKPGEQNLYDEYVYTETTGWEHIGDTSVDLTDYYTKEETDEKLNNKQDTLTPGDNITIENNVISASGGVPTFDIYIDKDTRYMNGVNTTLYSDSEVVQNLQTFIDSLSTTDSIIRVCFEDYNITDAGLIYCISSSQPNTNMQEYLQNHVSISYISNMIEQSINVDNNGLAFKVCVSLYLNSTTKKITYVNVFTQNSAYLPIKNTNNSAVTNFTPTKDYHPATKKYVDDNANTKIGENSLVFAKSFDYDTYPNSVQLFYASGCTDTTICKYFSDVLTKIYKASSSTSVFTNTMGGTLLLTFPGSAKNGETLCLYNYGANLNFIGIGHGPQNTHGITQYVLSFSLTADQTNKTITVTKAKIVSSQIETTTPKTDNAVSNKKYVDDLPKSYTGYDATKTQVLKNVNGTLTWVNEE